MAAGQQVDLSFLGDYASARGRLVVDEESQATSHKGVYAGGDIVSGPSTVISAIRQGRNLSLIHILWRNTPYRVWSVRLRDMSVMKRAGT